jgi:RNA polymerase sigma factor (sigma-70 family)
MRPDAELLRSYAETGSEEAFAELVGRHLNLVYSAALRQLNGDAHLAKDVSQSVFTDLARKASRLTGRSTLAGWLYTGAHHAAAKVARAETRRRAREQEAGAMSQSEPPTAMDLEWEKVRRVLDQAMHELRESDREAILLRYFENRQYAEVGGRLGLTENAARMRVERALEKLRASLALRGVTTAAALSEVLTAHAVQAAPAGLAATLTAASLAGAAGTATSITLIKALAMTQLKTTIIGAVAVAGLATAVAIQHHTATNLRGENDALRQQSEQAAALQADNEDLSNRLAAATAPGMNDVELMRLRGEVARLRQATNELARLQDENGQLRNLLLGTAARNAPPDNSDAQRQQPAMMARLNDVKMLAFVSIRYAGEHTNAFPATPEAIAPYLQDSKGPGHPEYSGTNDFDLVYQGTLTSVKQPGSTIAFRERQPWQEPDGKWARAYGFLDGHAEVHAEPDLNALNAWEQARIAPPPGTAQ